MERITDVLRNGQGNYILPFFWQHGESEEVLREYMGKIEDAGMRAVCIESRPHPDFLGEAWWRDMDILLNEAKKRDMKLWILDDSHFPTGYANGAVKTADDRLKKWHLTCKVIDVKGPLKRNRFPAASSLGIKLTSDFQINFSREELVAVIADKRTGADENQTTGAFEDVTHLVSADGYLHWDVPDGIYRLYIVTKKLEACCANNDYVNFLEKDSVRLLVDEVYEKHYQHYKEEFGKIAGFFSDEPGFYNCPGALFDYHLKMGRRDMPLPWSETLLEQLSARMGTDVKIYLPCLWFEAGDMTAVTRFEYMRLITDLYRENFSEYLGIWGEERNVEYIGHVIEDGNAHGRLGPGTGHYFKAMAGQHMSGIDVVLQQLVPGNDFGRAYFVSGNDLTDGEFYHYGLGKLGSSAAHVNPKTKGRCMCEIYGAYGWSESLPLMKWLADHMLARGVNWFVPHAFSPKEFPDMDCPPHFYARGNNPQYKYMRELFTYLNRMSHLLNGGKATADIAVLYHGEADWVGDTMMFQKIGKELMQAQMDFDVVPMEAVKESAVHNQRFQIGDASYRCLLIPGCERMPGAYLESLCALKTAGIEVLFVGQRPRAFGNPKSAGNEYDVIGSMSLAEVSTLPYRQIEISPEEKNLRFYRYAQEDGTFYLFLNENQQEEIDCDVMPKNTPGTLYRYDALQNKVYHVPQSEGEHTFHLHLAKWEAKLYFSSETMDAAVIETEHANEAKRYEPECSYTLSLKAFSPEADWEEKHAICKPQDLSVLCPGFSGTARYETEITLEPGQFTKESVLDLGECYDIAEVFVNNHPAGVRICAPYRFEAGTLLKEGTNHIRIEVATTLFEAMKRQDLYSQFGYMEPCGFFGPLAICK